MLRRTASHHSSGARRGTRRRRRHAQARDPRPAGQGRRRRAAPPRVRGVTAVRQGKRFELEVDGPGRRGRPRPGPRARRHAAGQPGHRGLRRPSEGGRRDRADRRRHLPRLARRPRRRRAPSAWPAARPSRSGTATPTCTASTPSSCPAASPTATTCAAAPSPASRRSWATIVDAANDGLPVLGICNGFQVLCESHLLPGALSATTTCTSSAATSGCGSRTRDTAWTSGLRRRARRSRPAEERRGRLRRRRARPSTSSRARAASSFRYLERATPTARCRDIAGITNAAATSSASCRTPSTPSSRSPARRTDGLGFFTSVLEERWSTGMTYDAVDTVKDAERDAGRRAALGRARPQGRRVRTDPRDPRPPPDGASWRCTRSCGASTAPTSPARCTCASSARRPPRPTALLVGIGENAGVVDVGQGYAVTFKVESHNHPSLHRALPGRGHRRRRHRPRHPRHGCPPGRGHRPAALRRGRPPRHHARPARRRRRHRRLRQLPRPAEHRRRGRLRRRATRATPSSTPSASASCAMRTSSSRTPGCRQPGRAVRREERLLSASCRLSSAS